MDRMTASKFCRAELDKHGLTDWHIKITSDPDKSFLGLCVYRDKCIIINAFHVDIHPDDEVRNTIRHEVAHALTPGHGHDEVWADKATEIGCDNTFACSHLSLPEHIIDAIRSGATVEMTVEEKVITNVIRTPKFQVTRLQEKCPECGKVAIEKFAIEGMDRQGNQIKMITLECFHIIVKKIPKATAFESIVTNDWKDDIKNCKHEWPEKNLPDWPKNRCLKCGEFKLLPFQVIGARATEIALAMQKGFAIFDDMGLGKTPQSLAVVRFHPELTPTLVVTKSAIKFQWFMESIRWIGPSHLPQVISTSRDFLFPGMKMYIIPYDLLRRFPREKIAKLGIKLVILDECQQIKNVDSTRTQEVRKLVSNNGCKVLPLSGTPWKNRGSEYFPVLNMIDPIKFYSNEHFLENWVEYYWQGNKKKMGGIRRPEKFREFTKSLLIRREYEEVMDEFPFINRMKLNVQLDDLAQSTYDDSVSDFVAWYNDTVREKGEEALSGLEILAKMSRMRHIVGLAKIPATLGFVEQFVDDTDKKLVIFVQHQDVGELLCGALTNTNKETNPDNYELAKTLQDEDIRIFKYTSSLNDIQRTMMQNEFNRVPRAIMLASTLAAGEGLNLQTCADTVLHERQWNPQNEDQAIVGRFRRIGQTSTKINISYPEAAGTVDEHLDALNEQKRRQFHVVMNKGDVPQTWNENEFAKELASLIIQKHKEKSSKAGRKPASVSITAMAAY